MPLQRAALALSTVKGPRGLLTLSLQIRRTTTTAGAHLLQRRTAGPILRLATVALTSLATTSNQQGPRPNHPSAPQHRSAFPRSTGCFDYVFFRSGASKKTSKRAWGPQTGLHPRPTLRSPTESRALRTSSCGPTPDGRPLCGSSRSTVVPTTSVP